MLNDREMALLRRAGRQFGPMMMLTVYTELLIGRPVAEDEMRDAIRRLTKEK